MSAQPMTPEALPDALGHFGPYGGRFVPETLMAALEALAEMRRLELIAGRLFL